MKKFKEFINEELSPEIYKSAADKLALKGHEKRSKELSDYTELLKDKRIDNINNFKIYIDINDEEHNVKINNNFYISINDIEERKKQNINFFIIKLSENLQIQLDIISINDEKIVVDFAIYHKDMKSKKNIYNGYVFDDRKNAKIIYTLFINYFKNKLNNENSLTSKKDLSKFISLLSINDFYKL